MSALNQDERDIVALTGAFVDERVRPRVRDYEAGDRATMALTEPGGGGGLQAMRTHAVAGGGDLLITGSKTWISNARHSIGLLCVTDQDKSPPTRA
ncbi:acyl-CoA dehydrogenase family protein [Nonomuraea sp. NBC_00507]|uniref:acyl-CoA dehydrogenase family protein n=1 Tax=Nonomuraea sp. NBC_00507 TaxID=2976002 RepID=UPI003FA60847